MPSCNMRLSGNKITMRNYILKKIARTFCPHQYIGLRVVNFRLNFSKEEKILYLNIIFDMICLLNYLCMDFFICNANMHMIMMCFSIMLYRWRPICYSILYKTKYSYKITFLKTERQRFEFSIIFVSSDKYWLVYLF